MQRMAELALKAAGAFDAAVRAVLDARGEQSSQRRVARLLGEDASNYSGLVAGRRSVSVDHVLRWVDAWESSGFPRMVFRFSGRDVRVSTLESSKDFLEPLPSGQIADFLDPLSVSIDPLDLFIGIARKRRYGGFLDVTVLHHLALCAKLANHRWPGKAGIAAYAAAHDLQEAYVGEMQRGLKLVLPDFSLIVERPWEARVHATLGLQFPRLQSIEAAVREVDSRVVALEIDSVGGEGWINRDYFMSRHGGPLRDHERVIAMEVLELSDAARWRVIAAAVNSGGGRLPLDVDARAGNPTRVGLGGHRSSDPC